MSKLFPNWFLLIHHWCTNKHRSGLTIPFLIGVEDSSIKDLLAEIAGTAVPLRK